jgi:hypothetical protein
MTDYFQINQSPFGDQLISVATTPTPVPDYAVVPVEIPTGWVMAGFLALLLLIMVYQNFKRLIIGLFRKKKI